MGYDDWPGVAQLMLASAGKLRDAGADFLICAGKKNKARCREATGFDVISGSVPPV